MIELLSTKQQAQAKSTVSNMIKQLSVKSSLSAYAILEPPQSDKIHEICLKSSVDYDEILANILPEFEDVGPRLIQLGRSEKFDEWFVEQAFFNHWSAIWVSSLPREQIISHLSTLIAQHDDEGNPMIFRANYPLTLNSWINALLSEGERTNKPLAHQTLGIFSSIYTVIDFPDEVNHWYFSEQHLNIEILSLLEEKPLSLFDTVLQPTPKSVSTWSLSATEYQALEFVQFHHTLLSVRQTMIERWDLLKKQSLLEVHKVLRNIFDICIEYNMTDQYAISAFASLYYQHQTVWWHGTDTIEEILSKEQLGLSDKLEQIDEFLEYAETQLLTIKSV